MTTGPIQRRLERGILGVVLGHAPELLLNDGAAGWGAVAREEEERDNESGKGEIFQHG